MVYTSLLQKKKQLITKEDKMNYTLEESLTITENLIKVFNNTTDENMQLKLEAMIKCFQHRIKSF